MKTLDILRKRISLAGGFVNAHAHFDRAYTANSSDFSEDKVNAHLFEKWQLVDLYKSNATEQVYFEHILKAVTSQISFGVVTALTFIDCDPVSQDRALNAALRVKELFSTTFNLKIACQTLSGVLDPEPQRWFLDHAHKFDVIGGLPRRDEGREAEHIDQLLIVAKKNNQRVHVHVDQLNSPNEKETELLARKTIQHGMEGRVTAVHSISLAAHKQSYRNEVYKICKDADLSFISCPTAWIDHRRNEVLTPTHSAITPVDELVANDLKVAIGSDNIYDVYKPFSDGDMMVELRLLLEANHLYDIDTLVDIASKNGREIIGLED